MEKFENNGGKIVTDFNTLSGSFCTSERVILTPNNKEIIKNTSSTSSNKGACAPSGDPSASFLRYGVEGLVIMTGEQYEALCNALGDEMAENYVDRLETYLISNPGVCLKSHYKTLRKWAAEDATV